MTRAEQVTRDTGRRPGGLLSRISMAHPRRTLAVLALLFAVAGVIGGPLASVLRGGSFDDPHSDSARASRMIESATGVAANSTFVVLVHPGGDVRSGAGMAAVQAVAARTRSEPQVVSVIDPYTTHDTALISTDGLSAYLVAGVLDHPRLAIEAARDAAADLSSDPRVRVGGYIVANDQVNHQVSADIGRAEIVAFPILFAVLVVVLRGVIVSFLPIAVGLLTIVTTFAGLRLVNSVTDVSIFALNLVTGMGLGLALDYGLLVINRYREEAALDGYGVAAMQRTLATAGRTVLFSALTVTAATGSLLVFPQQFLYSMGLGGVIAAPVAAIVALTLLPAAILALGRRIEMLGWFRLERERARLRSEHGLWSRLAHLVMRRPIAVAVTTGALLVALGLPFLRIHFTSVDASVLPQSASARQVDDSLRHDFAANGTAPLRVVLDTGAHPSAAGLAAYAQRLGALSDVAAVLPPRQLDATTAELDVVGMHPALDPRTQSLVSALRATSSPYPALVGGDAADFTDLQSSLAAHLPLAVALVGLTTILILFAMTGSVVLPLKAVLMNGLSLSAAFGILVLVFQDGRLTSLLQYTPQGGLESTQPILLFAIAFGLSTDYGVFLLQRIKEHHDAGMSTADAVSAGMQRTGRIVTAAALLFCIAIGAFASSSIVFIKEVGSGTALAVFLDATIVRALLVPALMALLGRWNWWAPRPLRALHRRLGLDRLEGPAVARGPAPPMAA